MHVKLYINLGYRWWITFVCIIVFYGRGRIHLKFKSQSKNGYLDYFIDKQYILYLWDFGSITKNCSRIEELYILNEWGTICIVKSYANGPFVGFVKLNDALNSKDSVYRMSFSIINKPLKYVLQY